MTNNLEMLSEIACNILEINNIVMKIHIVDGKIKIFNNK
jgi:hypothetical protein